MPCLPDFNTFQTLPHAGTPTLVPMFRRLFADMLTPVVAYRRLVQPDDRMAPSFLLESVVDGDRVGRYSFLGARPAAEVIAYDHAVELRNHDDPSQSRRFHSDDPLREMDRLTHQWKLARVPGLPDFTGGWVGFAGYDTVRYLESEKLSAGPPDDRGLPDLHMQLYYDVVAFDHVQKTVLAITHVQVPPDTRDDGLERLYVEGRHRLNAICDRLMSPSVAEGRGVTGRAAEHVDLSSPPPALPTSTMGAGGYQRAVDKVKEYIKAGDAFQVVPSQRFDLRTEADPFDIYRALRVVNPSPYMFYIQIEGGMLVASSPEILCRVQDGVVTNRPLAGTRRRGVDEDDDLAMEAELTSDPKDRAEHIMLVDLGRNDVGRVAAPGSVELEAVLEVERYSHVMHLSSTVKGKLQEGKDAWDVLRVTLPVGTVSGAPKVRAMQIIDELEPTRRGPYGGAAGYADFAGNMDMAICLRTMVIQPAEPTLSGGSSGPQWTVHLQAGGGIVYDSDPDAEHQETVNKAAALAKAVAVAERAFT